MRTLKDFPIRWKLVLISVLICAIAELLAGAIVAVYTNTNYRSEKRQEVTVQAQVLAASLTAPLVFGDREAAQEYLDALKANREIAAARIYSAAGTLFARYRRSDAPHGLLPNTAQPAGTKFTGERLTASLPVMQDRTRVGTVSLALDTDSLMVRLGNVAGLMLIAVIGSLLIVLPIAMRFNATISDPIRDMARAASRVTRGDFNVSVAESGRSDEVGVLQAAFAKMLDSIRDIMQQERLRALGQMSSGIAHDINNALSPVALYTQSLLEKEQDLNPRLRSYLETVKRVVDDITATVGRMRDFSRKRETEMALQPVNLNKLVQQVIDLTRARWSDMQHQQGGVIDVKAILDPDLPATMGVEGEIREALTNLIFNAIDAMPSGGTLTVGTGAVSIVEGPPRHVYVEVRDTGTGMDEETKRRIFEPFFTTKGERGTGLGMAMVYGVVQRHSAEIEIDSAPGEGTAARLIFMARTQIASAGQAKQPAQTAKALRILIVDDDPFVLDSMQTVLELDGHAVMIAGGGQQAIDMLQEGDNRFDVVISDLGMPHVDGNQVARAVKSISPSTCVILLTGWGRRMNADGAMPQNVDFLLSKPPELNELRATLALCG